MIKTEEEAKAMAEALYQCKRFYEVRLDKVREDMANTDIGDKDGINLLRADEEHWRNIVVQLCKDWTSLYDMYIKGGKDESSNK